MNLLTIHNPNHRLLLIILLSATLSAAISRATPPTFTHPIIIEETKYLRFNTKRNPVINPTLSLITLYLRNIYPGTTMSNPIGNNLS